MSGVVVATTIRSTSAGASDAAASALRDRGERQVATSARRRRRCAAARMPVRERIHSSLVATRSASASLVRMRSGRYAAGAGDAAMHGRAAGPSVVVRRAACEAFRRSAARSSPARRARPRPQRASSALANAKRVGAAVALDDDALEPDQRRAVVAARIDPALERHQHRIDDRRGDARQRDCA